MQAYEQALAGTSRARAPWYAIPADNKHYMRLRVAEIVVNALQSLGLKYPAVSKAERAQFAKLRRMLEEE